MKEWIYLRAISVRYGEEENFGVELPDGRIILLAFQRHVVSTFSSRAALQKYYPGAVLTEQSDSMNETINHVESED